jgi:hypothetical protein
MNNEQLSVNTETVITPESIQYIPHTHTDISVDLPE